MKRMGAEDKITIGNRTDWLFIRVRKNKSRLEIIQMDVHIERTRVGETEASNCHFQLNISLKWLERDMVISPLMTMWERKVLLRFHWATSECFVPIFHLSQHKVEQNQAISHANLKSCFDYEWVKNMFFWYFQSHVIFNVLVPSRTRTLNVEWSLPVHSSLIVSLLNSLNSYLNSSCLIPICLTLSTSYLTQLLPSGGTNQKESPPLSPPSSLLDPFHLPVLEAISLTSSPSICPLFPWFLIFRREREGEGEGGRREEPRALIHSDKRPITEEAR